MKMKMKMKKICSNSHNFLSADDGYGYGYGHGFRSIFTRLLKDCIRNASQQKKKQQQKKQRKKPQQKLLLLLRADPLLSHGPILHFIVTAHDLDTDFFYGSQLIRFYSASDDLPAARATFLRLPNPNPFAWSEIISAHAHHGLPCESIRLYRQMLLSGSPADGHVMVSVVQACARIGCLELGKLLHVEAMAGGFLGFMHSSTSMDMYFPCGRSDGSRATKRDVVMDVSSKCGNLDVCSMMEGDATVCNDNSTSIKRCGKCGNLDGRRAIQRDMVMCYDASVVATHAECKQLDGNHAMQRHVSVCNDGSFVIDTGCGDIDGNRIMPRCMRMCATATTNAHSKCGCLEEQLFHQKMRRNVAMCNNALIDMYAKCGSLDAACKLFLQMVDRDIVTWNSLMTSLMDHGHVESALLLFCRMLEEAVVDPDEVTFLVLVRLAAYESCYDLRTTIHCFIIERIGDELTVKVGSALIDMYVAHGSIYDAQKLFFDTPNRNMVTWTTMMLGYTQCGLCQEAFQAFDQMKQEGLRPDNIAIVSILQACATAVQLGRGKAVHLYTLDDCEEIDPMVGSALIDMYFKCGSAESAAQVFSKVSSPSGVIWNTMINGYAQYGAHELAIQCFQDMRGQGIAPDCATFVSIFSACSHAGVLEDGIVHLQSMVNDYDLALGLKHHMCLVDLLGRSGHTTYAQDLLQSLPFSPCDVGWRSLMTHCRTLGDVFRGRQCFDHLVQIDASEPTAYALMADIYRDAGMTEECEKMLRVGCPSP
jgi:pentatricopeptide repeat protein